MFKTLAIVTAALGVMLSPCVAQDKDEQAPDASPVVNKYDRMEKKELKEALKDLQKHVLVAERAAKQAKENANEAAAAYESASDEEKPDALLRMIEADAASRNPMERYKQVRLDIDAAKRAYLNMLLAAPANAEEGPAENESAKLQGLWNVTILEGGGKRSPADAVRGMRYLIKGHKISLTGKPEDLRRYRIDATATPKKIDIYGAPNDEFSKGIYELDGDTLRVCFSQSTTLDRPTDFDTAGTRYFCFTLKRAKP